MNFGIDAPATLVVLAMTMIVSVMAFRDRALLDRLMFVPREILAGKQYERLLTSGFIHGDWRHLAFNAITLLAFGRNIEANYGIKTLLLVYFSSILGGSLLSLFIHRHHDYRALGASGGVCGVLFVVFRHDLIGLFIPESTPPADAERLVALGSKFLIAVAAFQLFDAVAMVLSGALRGAGDTVWPGVATLVLSWTTIVAGGLAMTRFFPSLESVGPWIAAAAYVALLATALLVRFLTGRWKKIDLLKRSEGSAVAVARAKQEQDGLAS